MNALFSIVITFSLASADGGKVDLPISDVEKVSSAIQESDGGILGLGYWHSPERELKLGTKIVQQEAEIRDLKNQPQTAAPTWGPMIVVGGFALGFVAGIATTVYIIEKVTRP